MISVNDDEDLHFRKAEFDPDDCPLDCSRPCEIVCPANAISLEGTPGVLKGGVITERCYGCGRCFPVCPYDKIRAITYVRDATATAELLKRDDVDAVEIHTNGRQTALFEKLWSALGDSIGYLRLVAVSLPDVGDSTISSMNTIYSIMEPNLQCFNLWQLDGRPMSGDIGRGATREAIAFAVHLAAAKDKPQGFLQLAGGTNAHTINGLKKEGLFQTASMTSIYITYSLPCFLSFQIEHPLLCVFLSFELSFLFPFSFLENSENEILPCNSPNSQEALIGGVAYGGYARKIVGRVLSGMQSQYGVACIEDYPEHLLMALKEALALVGTVKYYNNM
ncbi:hypothetical protein F0562_005863 [Nyssa sinensis]|uniref:4Fe-4S ferredoxin-type domain-containing protein n=1 Tax=Nyssa sinensis TaxID=561372 RepID=A0A5J5AJM8_9ASTE|nr:hypothetical protein F0562_005863 [Nyssa sinensis]